MRKSRKVALFAVLLVVVLAGCAAGTNNLADVPTSTGQVAGWWLGLWHGMIMPITFVVSLFSDNVSIYEVHNNGGWYDFGFFLGIGITFGGGSSATQH